MLCYVCYFPVFNVHVDAIRSGEGKVAVILHQAGKSTMISSCLAGLCDQFSLCVKPGPTGVGSSGSLSTLGLFLYWWRSPCSCWTDTLSLASSTPILVMEYAGLVHVSFAYTFQMFSTFFDIILISSALFLNYSYLLNCVCGFHVPIFTLSITELINGAIQIVYRTRRLISLIIIKTFEKNIHIKCYIRSDVYLPTYW